ncbi:tRNA-splicing endonuclease subunit Sen34-like [Tigriopus californicus]|uniref:tRNA-splicing endonuclease subunit Sen34-like n=1 Tax=Tigriopus californicus TaxID=6832 RepID=UPI0027DA1CCE|nr:tRNA-splicing endonuclease subunit Sen34-like [Tigriopus californicus]
MEQHVHLPPPDPGAAVKIQMFFGQGLIWNLEDAIEVRTKHRILGSFIGCLPKAPRQVQRFGLPLLLSSEELFVLLKEKVAVLLEYQDLSLKPNPDQAAEFMKYLEDSFQGQIKASHEDKIQNIKENLSTILDGKRKKALSSGKAIADIREESVFQDEISKLKPLPEDHMAVQTFIEEIWQGRSKIVPDWNFPTTSMERLRSQAFYLLWQEGFHLTDGDKFGGDFLVYNGSPQDHHARFIVVCLSKQPEDLSPNEVAAKYRLGTTVKKTVLLAFFSPNEPNQVLFQSVESSNSNLK